MEDRLEQEKTVEIKGWVYGLLLIVSIVLPPVGLVAALVLITASDERTSSHPTTVRGKILIAVSLTAFIIQIIFGVIFILPLALKQVEEVFRPYFGSPYSGLSQAPGKEFNLPREVQRLYSVLTRNLNAEMAQEQYDDAREAIKKGSDEPLDRYIAASILFTSEIDEDLIEDDDERYNEIKRLILEGLELDGRREDVEKYLDAMMLTPLMRLQLEDEEYQEADATYNRLLGIEGDRLFEYLRLILERWAYDSLFEYWQLHKPEKALTIAIATLRQMGWTGENLQLSFFDYPYYGGIEPMFRLSRRLSREEDFFDLLEYFIKVTEDGGASDKNIAEAHHTVGYYLGKIGRWDEALLHLKKAAEHDPVLPAYKYAEIVAQYETGQRIEAAGRLFDAVIDKKQTFSMDDIRFLFYDHPSEGVDFLLAKLGEHPARTDLVENIAILAIRSGRSEIAGAALKLMEVNNSGETYGDVSKAAAEALASVDINGALQILDVAGALEVSDESTYIRVILLSAEGGLSDIVTAAETAIEEGPYERDPDFSLFETYFSTMDELGREDDAISFLKKIAKANENEAYPHYFLCQKLREVGSLEESMAELEALLSNMGSMSGGLMALPSGNIEGTAVWWFRKLNGVGWNDVLREKAIVARDMGDIDLFDQHLYWAHTAQPEEYRTYFLTAEREIEKGDLEEAGKVLDDISLSPIFDDRNGEPYKQLMDAYANLKAAGWVRERNFVPFPK